MVEALTDQKSGNSTPRCSKTVSPVFQLVCTTSRRSQVSSSYGCTPSVLKTRSIVIPAALMRLAAPLTVSVMRCTPRSHSVSVPAEQCCRWHRHSRRDCYGHRGGAPGTPLPHDVPGGLWSAAGG